MLLTAVIPVVTTAPFIITSLYIQILTHLLSLNQHPPPLVTVTSVSPKVTVLALNKSPMLQVIVKLPVPTLLLVVVILHVCSVSVSVSVFDLFVLL
jgi:hypothetical protein